MKNDKIRTIASDVIGPTIRRSIVEITRGGLDEFNSATREKSLLVMHRPIVQLFTGTLLFL